eukprot:gene17568-5495_t
MSKVHVHVQSPNEMTHWSQSMRRFWRPHHGVPINVKDAVRTCSSTTARGPEWESKTVEEYVEWNKLAKVYGKSGTISPKELLIDSHRYVNSEDKAKRRRASKMANDQENLLRARAMVPTVGYHTVQFKPLPETAITQNSLAQDAYRKFENIKKEMRMFLAGGISGVLEQFVQARVNEMTVAEILILIDENDLPAEMDISEFRASKLKEWNIAENDWKVIQFVRGDMTRDKFGVNAEVQAYVEKNTTHLVLLTAPHDRTASF